MSSSKLEKDIQSIQANWSMFISLVFQEMKRLYSEKEQLEIQIKKIERVNKIIKYSQNNIEIVIQHRDTFLEIDNTLVQAFKVLEAFQSRNALNNGAVVTYYSQILNSSKIIQAINNIDKLDQKIISLENKISDLENLREGKMYSFELIEECADKFDLDKSVQKSLFLYPVIKARKKKEKKINKSEKLSDDQKKVSTESVLSDIEVLDLASNQELEQSDLDIVESPEISYSRNVVDFNFQKHRYESLKTTSRELHDRYYNIISNLKPQEKNYYKAYSTMTKKELDSVGSFEGGYDDAYSKIFAIKLFSYKSEIENCLKQVVEDNYSNSFDIEYVASLINDYQSCLDQLSNIDRKIWCSKNELTSISNVYFLLDKNGELVIPYDVESYLRIYGKLIGYNEVDNLIVKGPIAFKEVDANIERTPYIQRLDKDAISYLKVRTGEGTTGYGILILTSSQVTHGFKKIKSDTSKISKQHESVIAQQIALIESRNPEFLSLQAEAKEKILNSVHRKNGDFNGK